MRWVATRGVLARAPFLGVACGRPNWIGCDRVGLTVWLRRPAVSITATIAGRALRLEDPEWSGPLQDGRRSTFAGFLDPAALNTRLHVRPDAGPLRWLGSRAPSPTVGLRIEYGCGPVLATRLAVFLNPGWG